MAIQIGGTTVIDNSRNLTNIASIFSCTGIASQAEAEAGTSSTKLMTPQRVAQAIAALGGGGVTVQRGQYTSSGHMVAHFGTTGSATIPISTVDPSKSFLNHMVTESGTGSIYSGLQAQINPTGTAINVNYRLYYAYSYPGSNPIGVMTWEVVEFD